MPWRTTTSHHDDEPPLALTVVNVEYRGWFRSHLKVLPSITGTLKHGRFEASIMPIGRIWFERAVSRTEEGVALYFVCDGRKWQPGDTLPPSKIIYRYEP